MFDCAGKGRSKARIGKNLHAAYVSFPSTGGVDVSLHTLGPENFADTAAAALDMPLG